jgi:hypothetical protein
LTITCKDDESLKYIVSTEGMRKKHFPQNLEPQQTNLDFQIFRWYQSIPR